MNPVAFIPLQDYVAALALKAFLALLATGLLGWQWWVGRRGSRTGRLHRASLILVGVLSGAAWWNWGGFHFSGGYVHVHELFHYYLGAKYFPELGYTGLYDCVVAAELEAGRAAAIRTRWTRDLVTNQMRAGSPVLQDPDICRSRFSDTSRWEAFKHDEQVFYEHMNPQKWHEVLVDHGFNATPVWTTAGGLIANATVASHERLVSLALLDPILLILTWALLWWAFGWRVLCVALVWWGTNYPARYTYTGGAFLRQDWLLMSVAAICFARRGWMSAAGFTLVWASLLRIFPGFIGLGFVLKAVIEIWRSKSWRLPGEYWRFAGGAALALLLFLPLSTIVVRGPEGGLEAWRGFVQNSRKHLSTPFTNSVGFPMVLSFGSGSRVANVSGYWLDSPWDTWKDARARIFAERRWMYVAALCAYLVVLMLAVNTQPIWIALALGVGAIPFFANLACYYYSVVLAFAVLSSRYPFAGIGLTLLSAVTCLIPALLNADDDRYTAISLMILVYAAATTTWVALRPQQIAGVDERSAEGTIADSPLVSSQPSPSGV